MPRSVPASFAVKAGQEVILCLLRSKNRYWRQYAECICGQENYILRCRSRGNGTYNILNMVDRIRYTGILGYAVICEIDLALCIQSNVFKQSITA